MTNVSHKKSWLSEAVKIPMYPLPIPLIKIKLDMKYEKDYVKIKSFRKPMSDDHDMFELIISGVSIISKKLQDGN